MKCSETDIPGILIIEPDVFQDHRGFFFESYSSLKYKSAGVTACFVQDNHALSHAKGTLRGLHYQLMPKAQAKLLRCLRGAVLDVAVDIRQGSPTYGKWISVELSAENHKQIFIPAGFAHGYVTLTADAEILYKTDAFYAPEYERCIRWNDPTIGVDWGLTTPILSDKDAVAPLFADCENNFVFTDTTPFSSEAFL